MKPLFSFVTIKRTPNPQSGTFLLPKEFEGKKRYGKIIGVGSEVPKELKENDTVMWFEGVGEPYLVNGEEFIIMPFYDLRAVV